MCKARQPDRCYIICEFFLSAPNPETTCRLIPESDSCSIRNRHMDNIKCKENWKLKYEKNMARLLTTLPSGHMTLEQCRHLVVIKSLRFFF